MSTTRGREELPLAARAAILAGAGGVGLLGALPAAWSDGDPVALLMWLGIWAPAGGFLCGAAGLRLLPIGLVAPAVWIAPLALLPGSSPEWSLPWLAWPILAWTGLFAAGWALGTAAPRYLWRGTGALLLLGALLTGMPGRGGSSEAPWPPRLTSLLLDLSPATLLVECGGVDWMRHPAVYGPAGSDRFLRASWRGSLAGPAVLLVGCGLAAAAAGLRRRGVRSTGPHRAPDGAAKE